MARGQVDFRAHDAAGPGARCQLDDSLRIASRASSGSRTTRSPAPREDLAHQPGGAGIGKLDDHRAVGELLDHGALLAQPAGPLRRDPDPGHVGGRHLAVGHPALDAGDLLDLGAGLEAAAGDLGLLDPVELEVAHCLAAKVIALDVPALAPVLEPVRLDLALGELVLVLLVVVDLEHLALGDRLVDRRAHLGVAAAAGGDLQAFLRGVVAERLDDLSRAPSAGPPVAGGRRRGRSPPPAPSPRAAAAVQGERSCRRRARSRPRSRRPMISA